MKRTFNMLTPAQQQYVISNHFDKRNFTRVKIIKVKGSPFLNSYVWKEGQITSMRLDPYCKNRISRVNVRFPGGRIVQFPIEHIVLDETYVKISY